MIRIIAEARDRTRAETLADWAQSRLRLRDVSD